MNISVTQVMAEFDNKAKEYGKGSIRDYSKERIEWCVFSDINSLNSYPKRTKTEEKIGDQRSIVDFLDFYPYKNPETDILNESEIKGPILLKKRR